MGKYEKREKVRKWLKRYRFIVKQIEAREKHLKEFIEELYNPLKAICNDGVGSRSGTISDQTSSTVIKMQKVYDNMVYEMHIKIKALYSAKKEIDEVIDSLDEDESCVLYHRFVLGIYWANLPDYINYEKSQCENIEVRAIDKIIKKSGHIW